MHLVSASVLSSLALFDSLVDLLEVPHLGRCHGRAEKSQARQAALLRTVVVGHENLFFITHTKGVRLRQHTKHWHARTENTMCCKQENTAHIPKWGPVLDTISRWSKNSKEEVLIHLQSKAYF